MKASIALVLIVVGLALGYVVSAGKFPNSAAATQMQSTLPTVPGGSPFTPTAQGQPGQVGGGPFPAPQMRY
jgi:hypothetical protein